MQRRFYAVLANSLAAFLTNTFVWFAVTFWVYLETQSVIATSVMAGVYSITVAVSGFFLGSLVDRYPKKRVMLFAASARWCCTRWRWRSSSRRRRPRSPTRPASASGSSSC